MERYPRHSSATASRLVGDEAVIVLLPKGEMTVLNGSGSLAWNLADGVRSDDEIAAALAEAYGLPEPPSLGAWFDELAGKGLLAFADLPAPDAAPPLPRPAAGAYEPPAVRVCELLETLAGLCESGFTGQIGADCRTLGSCFDAMS